MEMYIDKQEQKRDKQQVNKLHTSTPIGVSIKYTVAIKFKKMQ